MWRVISGHLKNRMNSNEFKKQGNLKWSLNNGKHLMNYKNHVLGLLDTSKAYYKIQRLGKFEKVEYVNLKTNIKICSIGKIRN